MSTNETQPHSTNPASQTTVGLQAADDLALAREAVVVLTALAVAADAAYTRTYGDDMAMVSGTRRKYSARATSRKFGAGDRTAEAWAKVRAAESRVSLLEQRAKIAKRDAPVPYTPADLKAARYVRNRHGWHKVARVNAKSVSVETGYSWVDRIVLAEIIEVRAA